MERGSDVSRTLAQQFFEELAGLSKHCDMPPEKSEQTYRIKLSSTPWVVPTTVDRRLGEVSETIVPKQRLNQATPSTPTGGFSPSRSPYGGGALSPLARTPSEAAEENGASGPASSSRGLDLYVALRPPSRDADRFDLAVRIVEDPSVLPLQPPAPVAATTPVFEAAKPSAPAPFASPSPYFTTAPQQQPPHTVTATPGKQIFKSPLPPPTAAQTSSLFSPQALLSPLSAFLQPRSSVSTATSKPPSSSSLVAESQPPSQKPQTQQTPHPQSILLSPTRPAASQMQPPSTTRKRVTFSPSVDDTPPAWNTGTSRTKPAPIQRSLLSPSSAPAAPDYRFSPY